MILTFLKYTGLFIAALSSIIGTITDARETKDGKEKITSHGWTLLVCIGLGFLLSVVSTVIEDIQKAKADEQAIRDDIKKTNKIVMSGQPLTSLSFSWRFHNLTRRERSFLDTCHSNFLRYWA
jgi:hypothetical protein